MKRKILGLMAIVLALSLSAFNAGPKYKNFYAYWWFPLDPASGEPHTVSTLVYQSFDPYDCTNWYWGAYCEGAFTSYGGSYGNYYAAGDEVLLDFHMPP
jgi:hypothetical protein